jgi:CRP-like cAMP-binding protein
MRTDPKMRELQRLFEDASEPELRAIASRADEIDVPAGFRLTQEGDRGREVVLVASGAATVTREGEEIATVGEGDIVGELALVTYAPRTATVTTTEPSRVFVLGERHFRELVDTVPAFSWRVFAAAVAHSA